MADVTLTYKGQNILELSASGNKTIKTAGKYCEADIGLSYERQSQMPEPPLPVTYQRVEYLEFVPNIGIIVDIPTSGCFTYSVDAVAELPVSSNVDSVAFGYKGSSNRSTDFELGFTQSLTSVYRYIRSSYNGWNFGNAIGESYTPGTRVTKSIILQNPYSEALIGRYLNDPGSSSTTQNDSFQGKIFSVKGIDVYTGEVVAWFVPCYRKSDNMIGVYDHISQTFYSDKVVPTSSSFDVGSITAGPDVT